MYFLFGVVNAKSRLGELYQVQLWCGCKTSVAIQRRLGEPKEGENKEGCKGGGGKLAVQTLPRMQAPELSLRLGICKLQS